jgi:hypothetical protein
LAIRLSQPTDTVRDPVSSRPIVWAVVGGSQRLPTSYKVSRLALRTSRIAVIMTRLSRKYLGVIFSLSYTPSRMARENHSNMKGT